MEGDELAAPMAHGIAVRFRRGLHQVVASFIR
jgi:hypothetical protein